MLGVVGRGALLAVPSARQGQSRAGRPGLTATTHNAFKKQLIAEQTNSA